MIDHPLLAKSEGVNSLLALMIRFFLGLKVA